MKTRSFFDFIMIYINRLIIMGTDDKALKSKEMRALFGASTLTRSWVLIGPLGPGACPGPSKCTCSRFFPH